MIDRDSVKYRAMAFIDAVDVITAHWLAGYCTREERKKVLRDQTQMFVQWMQDTAFAVFVVGFLVGLFMAGTAVIVPAYFWLR
jgi:hypothetical protein